MLKVSCFLFVTIVLLFETVISENVGDNGNSTVNEYSVEGGSRVLSRRKRYLIFPEGSSLQLVFCCQTAAVIPIGDIFLYGNTAALAWNLPTDPMFFNMFKGSEAEKRMDMRQTIQRTVTYVDENGRVLGRVPYKRRTIVNPAFGKRSIEEKNNMSFKEKLKIRLDKMKMHQHQSNREYLNKDNLDKYRVEFHRSTRLDLFGKVETLLRALGLDGRQCVLYKLCESAQRSEQGTFLQEFLRAVFTLPKGDTYYEDHHKEYDLAHNPDNDCSAKYPGCDNLNK